jgi:hypothetical protein
MQYNGSSSLISYEADNSNRVLSLQGNLNTRRGKELCPHTHQPSPSIPRQQRGAHRLGLQCLTDPDWLCSDRTCTHDNAVVQ